MGKKKQPWPIPKLLKANRNALTVYTTIRMLAGKRLQFCKTRSVIGDVCGLHQKRITEAFKALADGGWITLNYGRHGVRRWYRISFQSDFFPMGMKTTHRDTKVGDKIDPIGIKTLRVQKRPSSSKEEGEGSHFVSPSPLDGATTVCEKYRDDDSIPF